MSLRSLRFVWGSALLSLTVLGGCATGGAVKNVQSDVGQTQDQLRALERRVAALDSVLRAQGAESRRMLADLDTGGDEIKQRMRQTQAKLDDVARRLADLSKTLESVRLSSGSRAAPFYGRNPAASPPGDSLTGARPPLISDAQGLFDQASEDMKAGDYGLAVSEFLQFLESFPQSDLVDNARYWLGKCYQDQKDLPRAIDAFQRVIADHPNSEILPGAMLELGETFIEAKEREKGIQQLRNLTKSYPNTEEAGQARERLKTLGGASRPPGKHR